METKFNFAGGSVDNQNPRNTYKSSINKSRGCLGLVSIVVILAVILIVGIYFAYPSLTPNSIHGDFMSMAIVPQKDGSQKLWILTDGSFSFIQSTKSPGSYSVGRKCIFCKTWTYIYDPATQEVIKKIKTKQEDIITRIEIFYKKGKVWQVTGEYGENEPKVDVYDAETTEKTMDTKAFISKYDALSAGLAGIRYDEKDNTIVFKTKDGKEQVTYSVEEDKLYENHADFSKERRTSDELITSAVLSPESSSSKKFKLYKITGPAGKVNSAKSTAGSFAIEKDGKSVFLQDVDIQPTTEKGYLEGILYYNDNDCGIIVYLDQIGRKSSRLMSCVDLKTGQEKWTAGPDMLFKEMKIDEDKNSFSSLFFTKDKIKIRRSGNLVVLELQGEGIIGFDYETGKQLWKMSI